MQSIPMKSFCHLPARDGIGSGNFAIGGTLDRNGRMLEFLTFNPSTLGAYLRPLQGIRLTFLHNDTRIPDAECATRHVDRAWPFQRAGYADHRLGDVRIEAELFAPLAFDDEATSSLPALLLTLHIHTDAPGTPLPRIEVDLSATMPEGSPATFPDGAAWQDDEGWIGATLSSGTGEVAHTETGILLTPQGDGTAFRLALTIHDGGNRAAADFPHAAAVGAHALREFDTLRDATRALESRLPFSGDPELDTYLRWYTTAAVLLTRLLRDGTVLTLGYTSLNQRDSFWTCWAHLDLWPTLERRMIDISAAHQQENGRIPTCILNRIERDDDLDIQLYYILRVFRFHDAHPDAAFLQHHWPHILRGLAYTASRDTDGGGLPVQGSFWGDWKDVSGVDGRKYAPHVCLLYIAVLQRAVGYARESNDADALPRLQSALDNAVARTNAPLNDGGLWNGGFYEQRWHVGREDGRLLQDQVVGILFNAMPPERATSVLDCLKDAVCPHGVRETWLYWPDDFGNGMYKRGGQYHNGGVWSWLNFAQAMAEVSVGRTQDAVDCIRRVGRADLQAQGDWSPHEFVDAETGENRGPPIQGWSAACYGAMKMLAAAKPS